MVRRVAALGLTAMRLLAVGVRIRIGDTFLQTLQALLYLVLNSWLFWEGF